MTSDKLLNRKYRVEKSVNASKQMLQSLMRAPFFTERSSVRYSERRIGTP